MRNHFQGTTILLIGNNQTLFVQNQASKKREFDLKCQYGNHCLLRASIKYTASIEPLVR